MAGAVGDGGRATPTFSVPIRRFSDAKHRIQRDAMQQRSTVPGASRGVNRGVSLHSGLSGRRTVLQLDEQNVGQLPP